MKAHIARNQNAGVPLALGWNLSAGDRGKLDGMAPAFGMKVLPVSPADAGKTVAQLLGAAGSAGFCPGGSVLHLLLPRPSEGLHAGAGQHRTQPLSGQRRRLLPSGRCTPVCGHGRPAEMGLFRP